MSTNQVQRPPDEGPQLEAEVQSMSETEDGFEITIKLRNPLDRAVHYISSVRAMIFDPANRRFRVQLSDRGREQPPGGMAVEPTFRTIDPHSEALATVRVPKTIVKLADTPSPPGDVLLEEHAIADATSIELEIGWADTPYYTDPREKTRGTEPISAWEQRSARTTFRRGSD
jgi:hypothetical protein